MFIIVEIMEKWLNVVQHWILPTRDSTLLTLKLLCVCSATLEKCFCDCFLLAFCGQQCKLLTDPYLITCCLGKLKWNCCGNGSCAEGNWFKMKLLS